MLWAIPIIFLLLWAIELITSSMPSGFVYVLVVAAVVLLLVRIIKGASKKISDNKSGQEMPRNLRRRIR